MIVRRIVAFVLLLAASAVLIAGSQVLVRSDAPPPEVAAQAPAAPPEPPPKPHKAQAQVAAVSRIVERLRGLRFKRDVALRMGTREDVEKLVLAELEKEWPPEKLRADERTFKIVGLLPETYDLQSELVAIYREQAAGLYDQKTDTMLLVDHPAMKGLTRTLLAHELTHALQDQHFDLTKLIARCSDTLDGEFVLLSLLEGEATHVMMAYFLEKGPDDPKTNMGKIQEEAMRSSKRLLSAPPWVQHRFLSPYFDGLAFITHFRKDGWERVNRIYDDLPLSAEQILHPRKYYPRRDFPKRIDLVNPVVVGGRAKGPWRRCSDTTLGEIGVIALVETWGKLLGDATLTGSARKVAGGWDGDRLVRYEDATGGDRTIVFFVTTWDTPEDAAEMHDACRKWAVHWAASAKAPPLRRGITVARPERDGRPGLDVICVLTETPTGSTGPLEAVPAYTRTVVRTLGKRTSGKDRP